MNTQGEASCPTICTFPSWWVIFVHCALLGHCMASIFGARNSDRDAACRAVRILCFPANLSLARYLHSLHILDPGVMVSGNSQYKIFLHWAGSVQWICYDQYNVNVCWNSCRMLWNAATQPWKLFTWAKRVNFILN